MTEKYTQYLDLVKENGLNLNSIHSEERNQELSNLAFNQIINQNFKRPYALYTKENDIETVIERILSYIPKKFRTYEMCLSASKLNPYPLFGYIPKEYLIYEIYLETVKASYPQDEFDEYVIAYIPDEFKTYELCWETIQKYHPEHGFGDEFSLFEILPYIPEEIKTYAFYVEIIKLYDCDIDKDVIPKKYLNNKFEIVLNLLNGGSWLQYTQLEFITYEMVLDAIQQESGFRLLPYIPDNYLTKELWLTIPIRDRENCQEEDMIDICQRTSCYDLCLELVKEETFYSALEHIKEEFHTYDFYLEVARHYGYQSLLYITYEQIEGDDFEDLIDDEVLLLSRLSEPKIKNQIPIEFQSDELYLAAFNYPFNDFNNQDLEEILAIVPTKYHTPDIYLAIIKRNPLLIKDIPGELQNYSFYVNTVRQNGKILQYLPQNFVSDALYLEATKSNGVAFDLLPEEYKTYEICIEAVVHNPTNLRFVPDKHKVDNFYIETFNKNHHLLWEIPEALRTCEMYYIFIQQTIDSLKKRPSYFRKIHDIIKRIPNNCKSYQFYLILLENNITSLKDVPDEHKTYELCLAAVTNNGDALEYVPDEYKTYDICLVSVKNAGWALSHVPNKHRTYELCLIAINQDGHLEDIPNKLKTFELCAEAIKKDPDRIQSILPLFHDEKSIYQLCLEAVKQDVSILFWYVPFKFINQIIIELNI
ncbi:DUF4116 domain-containing protein [Entomospira culicis]|uniref:DUF4116 domain-containing protein n=1 Tax=Entomospira culicis TaxID=2719989 RepID=A0A968KX06_9SPIO|nr:DUF4116 domain-containing protein [Entomospira culicis]NIZ19263.1 DUF4116 domain-containing protein [Entomospira culicis]NIZ69832.1 DUF4116 domain-containing protein [Entomospira culicis]WDI36938.1 DUF4116 domain-containing protein [Entomospira culicis]WDI38567.1 DUF4116 domain-containing protein [Entomospira culicis]